MTGLPWWQWGRARRRVEEWVRTLIGDRPYSVAFAKGRGSYVDFTARAIVIDPEMPTTFSAEAACLPTTWHGHRVERGGQLGVLCARAAAYHEGGHVLFTTPVAGLGGVLHGLWNALEDQRMEDLVARHYPPAGPDFAELGRRFWLCEHPGTGERLSTLLNACLYHRWDNRRRPGEVSRLAIPAEDRALWEGRIRPLVEAAWLAADSRQVVALAREILGLLGIAPTLPPERFPGLLIGQRGCGSAAPRGLRSPDDPAQPGGTDAPSGGVARTGEAGGRRRVPVGGPAGTPDPDLADPDLASASPDVDPSAGRLWMQPFAELEKRVAGDVRRLQRELRMATPDAEPEANSRRGRFDARAHVRSQGKRPLVRPAQVGDGPEALAFLLVIDGTGSMGGDPRGLAPDGGPADPLSFNHPDQRLPHVRPAVLALQRACAGLHIPLAIALACDAIVPSPVDTLRGHVANPVHWLQRFETDPESEGPRALIAGLNARGLAEAVSRTLRVCQEELHTRPEPRKVLLYIHDGEPTDERPEEVRATVEEMRRAGIVMVGLYLGEQSGLCHMEAIFGARWTIGAESLPGLTLQLGRILKRFRERR